MLITDFANQRVHWPLPPSNRPAHCDGREARNALVDGNSNVNLAFARACGRGQDS
jgi:hypothetical protein